MRTAAQTRASKENAAIWMLKGFQRTVRLFIKPLKAVDRNSVNALLTSLDWCIADIKHEQHLRQLTKGKSRK